MTAHFFACDISKYQNPLDGTYPRPAIIFRVNDGTLIDTNAHKNLATCVASKMDWFAGYCVYRPGIDAAGTLIKQVGKRPVRMLAMLDVETWGGEITGDHHAEINAQIAKLAKWAGAKRTILYGNLYDLAALDPIAPKNVHYIIAGYSASLPSHPRMIGWQYTDGETKWAVPLHYPRSTKPFGACDHNVFPMSVRQFTDLVGITKATPPAPASPNVDAARARLEMAAEQHKAPKGPIRLAINKALAALKGVK